MEAKEVSTNASREIYMEKSKRIIERSNKKHKESILTSCNYTLFAFLLKSPSSINLDDEKRYGVLTSKNGINPLMIGCALGDIELIDYSVKYGFDVNAKTKNGITASMIAAYRGKLETLKHLESLNAKIDVDSLYYSLVGMPRNILLDFKEFLELEKYIQDKIYNSVIEDINYDTELLDRLEIIKYLIEKRLMYSLSLTYNKTALDFYLENKHMTDLEMIDYLTSCGIVASNDYLNIYKKYKEDLLYEGLFPLMMHYKELKVLKEKAMYLSRKQK